MKKKVTLSLLLLLGLAIDVFAQTKTKTSQQQVWLGYFNQSRFSNKWGLWVDVHLRTKEDFFTNFSQAIYRGGITYYLNDATKLTIGDAYISHFPSDNHKKVTQPEHRPWQQLQWHTVYPKVRTMQWVRLEERFRRKILNDSTLADGSSFNFRARYNFLLQVPLTKGKIKAGDFSFILNDEVHLNFGKQILNNTFDQNRAFIGFAYHVNNHDNLQFGYMNLWQQLAGVSNYRSTHTARVFYFHNIDWRTKQ
ncbi:MAG TPA: DUF2490 domain-containing protein [Flavisolibacter sp.]|nr:DUF2490 domain-containing protein [Flavisolibacter sp.]